MISYLVVGFDVHITGHFGVFPGDQLQLLTRENKGPNNTCI